MLTNRYFASSPIFVVSNVLLISSPPALTLAQVCALCTSTVAIAQRYHILDNTSSIRRCLRTTNLSYHLLVVLCRHTTQHHHLRCRRLDPCQALKCPENLVSSHSRTPRTELDTFLPFSLPFSQIITTHLWHIIHIVPPLANGLVSPLDTIHDFI